MSNNDQWVIWCGLNTEQDMLEKMFGDECVSVRGSQDAEEKAELVEQWTDGKKRVLISKPKVLGFGMNFQNAHKMCFFGLSDSWESYYQCIRREWRFGQKYPVEVHIVISELEREIYDNVIRKEQMANEMATELIVRIVNYEKEELNMTGRDLSQDYKPSVEFVLPAFLTKSYGGVIMPPYDKIKL